MAKRRAMKHTVEDAKKATTTSKWLESLFQNSKDPIVFADVNGNLQTVNGAFENLTGYSRDELVQKTFMEITPKKYLALEARLARRVIKTGVSTEFEKEYIHKDGSHIPILLNAFRVDNEAGEPIGTGAIITNLTERKKMEETLQASKTKLKAQYKGIPIPIYSWRKTGEDFVLVDYNDAADEMTQGKMTGFVGTKATDMYSDNQDILDDLRRCVLEKSTIKRDMAYTFKTTGKTRRLHVSYAFIPPDMVAVGAEDITERMRAEEQVKNLAKFPSENPSPVLRIAGDGTILFANSAAEMLLEAMAVDNTIPDYWKKLTAEVLKSGKVKKNIEIEHQDRVLSFTGVPVPEGRYINIYGLDVTERKRAEKALKQSLSDTEALRRLSASFAQTLELDEILDTALNEISSVLSVQHSCVYVFDQTGNLVIRGHRQLTRRFLEGKGTVSAHEGCIGQAIETKEIFAPPPDKHDFICEDSKRLLHLDCLAAIPIISKRNVLGALEIFAPVHRRLSDREREIVMIMANQLASAIDNANLYSKERNIANTLQETLLTVPEKIEGISFGHLYRSATAEVARAGGDFYDLFDLEDGKVGITIGDVSGKGLEAASLTSLVKNTIKAYAHQHPSPSKVMALANDLIVKNTVISSFVTLFFGILDKESGVLLYCSAGHPQQIIIRRPSTVSLLKTSAPIIGVFEDVEYKDFETTLRVGDILFLYTDGATEARRDQELFGEKRLVNLIKDLHSTEAQELPQRVFDKLFDFAQGTMVDDTALMTVCLK